MSGNYYDTISQLLEAPANIVGGVKFANKFHWYTAHSLISSNKQLSTSLLKTTTHINDGDGALVALSTGDPIRSNIYAYWSRKIDDKTGLESLEYRRDGLMEGAYLFASQTCVQQAGKASLRPPGLLSKKYSDMGLDMFFAPRNDSSQGLYDDDTAWFGVAHKQSLIFSFDFGKFWTVAMGENPNSALWSLGDDETRPIVSFYSLLASLLTSPGEKFHGNPKPWSRWTTPDPIAKDDSTYKGFFNYPEQIVDYLAEDPNGSAEYPFLWTIAYYSLLLHGKMFYDLSFDAPLPMSERVNTFNNMLPRSQGRHGKGGGYIEIKPVYNFYVPLYERGIVQQADLKEYVLPNIYAFSDYELNTDITSPGLVDNLTLQGKIPESQLKGVLGINEEPVQGTMNSNQYFDLFGKLAFDVKMTDEDMSKAKRKFSNIFISPNNLKFIEETNERKSAFPMYVDIKFDATSPGSFCSMLAETNNAFDLMKAFAATWFTEVYQTAVALTPSINTQAIDLENFLTSWKEERPFNFCTDWERPPAFSSAGGDHGSSNFNDHTAPMFDVCAWWFAKMEAWSVFFHGTNYNTASEFMNPLFANYGTFLGDWSEASPTDPSVDFANQIKEIIYAGKFKKLIKQHLRSYEEMLLGKKAYSEVVFYRIEKTGFVNDGIAGAKVRLQNIWVPNMPGHDIVNYIDTQVKYGYKYQYRVFAYKVVIGSKYSYGFYKQVEGTSGGQFVAGKTKIQDWLDKPLSYAKIDYSIASPGRPGIQHGWNDAFERDPSVTIPDGGKTFGLFKSSQYVFHASMDVRTEPDVYIVEVPIYETSVVMMDSPPMSPDVEINSYIGVNNKVCINLNSQSGDRNIEPVVVEPEDQTRINLLREAQGRDLWGPSAALGWNWIDPTLRFKFDDHPAAFQVYRIDFKPSNYSDFTGSRRAQISTKIGSDYVDKVIPNKKYYYMFRTVDIHDNISNPSIIYEVEMVSEGEVSFLLCEVVDFETEKEKNRSVITTKPMRRYIKIFPSDIQLILNESFFDQNVKSAAELALVDGSPTFGAELDESVFDNKVIKVRLTSKSTGRKIDLNLKFVVEHVPTDQKLLNK